MTMARPVRLEGVYELPRGLGVTEKSLGKTLAIEVGGVFGKVLLPRLVWSGDDPRVEAPALDSASLKAMGPQIAMSGQLGIPRSDFWGRVTAWHRGKRTVQEVRVRAVGLKFSVPEDQVTIPDRPPEARGPEGQVPQAVLGHVDAWFERLRTWVEVAVDQDADPSSPIQAVWRPGRGLSLFRVQPGVASRLANMASGRVMRRDFEPINLPRLRKAAAETNAGATPSDSRLLLRDARAAFRRDKLRIAVIDAGSAVELALVAFNRAVTQLRTPPKPTLGWYTGQPTIQQAAPLPPTLTVELVEVRNRAIHQNVHPSRGEGLRALDLAKDVLDKVEPLPL
jgi:hypothetical protein